MTVKELIEILSKQPQEATVEIGNGYGDWANAIAVHTDLFEADEADEACFEAICFIEAGEI